VKHARPPANSGSDLSTGAIHGNTDCYLQFCAPRLPQGRLAAAFPRPHVSCRSATSVTFAIIGAMLSVTIRCIICMSCIGSFSATLGAACSGPNGPSLSPSSGGALAPRCATMLRSGCISKMTTVPTNRTNARAEEAGYTNRGTNAPVSRPLSSNLRKEPAPSAAPLLLYTT
jgi:hypothetical protein